MSFARKGRNQKVYTFRGPEADYEDGIPMTVEEPPKNAALPTKPEKLCSHGGLYRDDIPMCGFCFKQPNSGLTPDEAFAAFLSSMLDVCKRVVWKSNHRDFRNMSYEAKVEHAFAVLSNPKNLLKIMKARNPLGLAYRMADWRLMDLYRTREFRDAVEKNSRELVVSQLNLPRFDEDDELAERSTSTKLDWQDGRQRAGKDGIKLMLEEALYRSESTRRFPGVELLWTPENVQRLVDLARDAMTRLPKEPFDYSVLISLRSNAYGGKHDRSRGWDWRALAKWASGSQGRNVTEKQVRHAFAKGTEAVRNHILQYLTPDLGAIVAKTPTRGSIKPKLRAA